MDIPSSFQEKIKSTFGDAGEKWLLSLEATANDVAEKWNLTLEEPVANLSYNYVVNSVDSEKNPFILKLGVPGFDFRNEVKTVQAYRGNGCARILKADLENGAMLLEKLLPGTMLCEEKDETTAVQVFCHVWKEIRQPLPEEGNFPLVTDWARAFANYRAAHPAGDGFIPNSHVDQAEAYLNEIMQTSPNIQLLHGDLHHENILYSQDRGWLAIDPKGVGGDPCFDVVSFLINHLFTKPDPRSLLEHRVNLVSDLLEINRERLLRSAFAMSTLYACWAIEDNDDYWKETYQCAIWFAELLETT